MEVSAFYFDNERLRLNQLKQYFTSLEEDVKTMPEPMITAAIHCLSYVIKASKMQPNEIEPFKPLVQTDEYTGKCRRNKVRAGLHG